MSELLESARAVLSSVPGVRRGILVAFSGGIDSRTALDCAQTLSGDLGAPVQSIHIDHGLREDSVEDAAFCAETCAALGIPHRTVRISISPGASAQAAARAQRWAAIALEAARRDAACVVTGHHAQDAVEGALIQMMRGSSSLGMSSLARPTAPIPVPGLGASITLARPLARSWPHEIFEHAAARALSWHEDPTNAASTYTRNALRHGVLGELLAIQGSPGSALRTLEHLAGEADAITRQASAFASAHVTTRGDIERSFPAAASASLPDAVFARLLITTLGVARDAAEVDAVRDVVRGEAAHALLSRARARSRGAHIGLERTWARGGGDLHRRIAHHVALGVGERTTGRVPWFGAALTWGAAAPSGSGRASCVARFSEERAPVAIRGPRPGERILSASGREERVREVLRRAGIAPMDRWRAPCVVDKEDVILWIPQCTPAPDVDGAIEVTWTPRTQQDAKGNV
ncbi:MAG: tRNA lysidine(34) synthetase TilS [Myxococcota bacterium]